jgi:hypothetical protein
MTADIRARLAAAADRVTRSTLPGAWPEVARLDGAPVPPGFTAWRIGPEGGPVTVLPTLDPAAPLDVRRRYLARAIGNGTGRCPLCSAVAGVLGPDPEHGHRAGFHLLPVTVGIRHAPDCPAEFTDAERHYFPAYRRGDDTTTTEEDPDR